MKVGILVHKSFNVGVAKHLITQEYEDATVQVIRLLDVLQCFGVTIKPAGDIDVVGKRHFVVVQETTTLRFYAIFNLSFIYRIIVMHSDGATFSCFIFFS